MNEVSSYECRFVTKFMSRPHVFTCQLTLTFAGLVVVCGRGWLLPYEANDLLDEVVVILVNHCEENNRKLL